MEILDRFIKGQNPHSGIDFKHPGNKPNSTNKLDLNSGASAPSNPSKPVNNTTNMTGKSVPQNIVVTPF